MLITFSGFAFLLGAGAGLASGQEFAHSFRPTAQFTRSNAVEDRHVGHFLSLNDVPETGSIQPASSCCDSCANNSAKFGCSDGCGAATTLWHGDGANYEGCNDAVCSGDGCSDGGCAGTGCDGAGCADGGCVGSGYLEGESDGDYKETCRACCGCAIWTHRTSVYGEYLYLRPREADVVYAVPIDGPIVSAPNNNPIQVGSLGIVDPDYESSYRVGINVALTARSSIDINYLNLDSNTRNSIQTNAPFVMRSLVSHPSTLSAAADFLTARAELNVNLDVLDLSFRHVACCGDLYVVNYRVGARYARLEQEFGVLFTTNDFETVATDIDFDGGGLGLGFEAERYACFSRLHVYAKGNASLLAGQFRVDLEQTSGNFSPLVVDTDWEGGRVVPMLDIEVGAGWTSANDCLHLRAGYVFNAWYNTVKTENFVHAVQHSNFLDIEDRLSFDGLVARAEWRF